MTDVIYTPSFTSNPVVIPPKATRTVTELCLLYGQLKTVGWGKGTIGYDTIYTVPENKLFLLVSSSLCLATRENQTSNVALILFNPGADSSTDNNLMRIGTEDNTFPNRVPITIVDHLNPVIPLIFQSGYYFRIFNPDANSAVHTVLVGYEIDKNIFYSNI
jgi:hypothetical protein